MYIPVVPLSGVGGFRFLQETGTQQRQALAQSADVERDVDYFKENIGKIRSAEELIADRRLLTVALTAYGLESEIDKTAFIENVLESDPDVPGSFSNRLNDRRWTDFANAFGFADPGAGREANPFQVAVELKFRGEGSGGREEIDPLKLAGFRDRINTITTVDELLADADVLDVALQAFGLERGYYTDDHFRQVLTDGFGNDSYAASLDDFQWVRFAEAFTGLGDGAALTTVSPFQLDVEREIARNGNVIDTQENADASTSKLSNDDIAYFQGFVETMQTGADVVADERALKVALVAYGLGGASVETSDIAALLDGAIAGDLSLAEAQGDNNWVRFAESFANSVNGGSAARETNFSYKIELEIADENLEFIETFDGPRTNAVSVRGEELAYFNSVIGGLDTAEALVSDSRALEVALTAFGLEDDGYSASFLQSILEEDPAAPESFINITSNENLKAFAEAFNGTGSSADSAIWRYEIEERLIANGAPEEDLDYLRSNFNLIDDVFDWTLDARMADIAASAFGLEQNTYTTSFILSALLSDTTDPRSFANVIGDDRWVDMANTIGSFSGRGGNVQLESFQTEVTERYREKLFQVAVGDQDQNLRIALNFEREISSIASSSSVATAGWFQILGDEPLRRVVDAAFGLPTQFAQLEIDAQVEVYEEMAQRLFGGRDPSVFQDAAVVQQAIDRYLSAPALSGGLNPNAPGFNAIGLIQNNAAFAQSLNQRV